MIAAGVKGRPHFVMSSRTTVPYSGETYLSARGYGFVKDDNPELVDALRHRLTVKPYVNPNSIGANNVREFPVYCESKKKLYIPRVYGLRHFGVPTHDDLTSGSDAPNLVFNGTLRPEQEPAVAAFMQAARDPQRRGGIISAGCGFGKTNTSIYIACQFRKKTLVVCHKGFLLNQWHERIQQFVPNARVGLIKQDKVVTNGCDIVLASLQSLAMRDYDSAVFKGVHLTIIDEIHHTSAEVFSRALPKITAPVMLGLSATLKRTDGLSKVFEWHVGAPVFTSKKKDTSTNVLVLQYSSDDPEFSEEIRMWTGKLNVAQMITRVCSYHPRNEFIIEALEKLLENEPNRKTLILSDRRGHLTALEKMIMDRGLGSVGYYVGGMKQQDLKESERKDVLLGTFTMACVADTTIVIDPITGKENMLRDFEEFCKRDATAHKKAALKDASNDKPYVLSMYYTTGSFYIAHAARFGYSPQKPCVRIIHELGDITVSIDHKVCTMDGWKPAGQLTLSDYLIAPRRIDIKARDAPHLNCSDLWCLGCFIGQLGTKYPVEEDVLARTGMIMEKSKMANNLCMMAMLQKEQHDDEIFIGIDVMFVPDEKVCALLGGLFDLTGIVDGYTVYYSVFSVRLANQIGTLLRRLHIRSRRTSCVKPGFPYYVEIELEDIQRFANIMDIRGTTARLKLDAATSILREFQEVLDDRPVKPAMVSNLAEPIQIYGLHSVDPSTVKLCDIEVPIHHSFVASGIVVHNSEGMDIPALDTLVLASPVSSIEQAVGRIQRQKENERAHVSTVIDIWDQHSLFRAQGIKRQKFYKKNKYNITVTGSDA